MRLLVLSSILTLLASVGFALPVQDATSVAVHPELPRLVIYFQTTHDSRTGEPISMLPLITELDIALTHLIVCSFHINLGDEIHLNDYPPHYPLFSTLWNETLIMKQAGVKVMGMIGGAAPGSFDSNTLDSTDEATFEHYYGQLRDVIAQYGLQGMDLDVEQYMSQAGIARLVARLHADFGDGFIITLAPVASAMSNGGNLSGFDYGVLESSAKTASGKDMIDFYNAQF
jgi:chitinase